MGGAVHRDMKGSWGRGWINRAIILTRSRVPTRGSLEARHQDQACAQRSKQIPPQRTRRGEAPRQRSTEAARGSDAGLNAEPSVPNKGQHDIQHDVRQGLKHRSSSRAINSMHGRSEPWPANAHTHNAPPPPHTHTKETTCKY